jgi:hypothetical protein
VSERGDPGKAQARDDQPGDARRPEGYEYEDGDSGQPECQVGQPGEQNRRGGPLVETSRLDRAAQPGSAGRRIAAVLLG